MMIEGFMWILVRVLQNYGLNTGGKTTNRVKEEEVASNVVLLITWLRIALVILLAHINLQNTS